jgi:outer membrane biosynthesis protein TonB
VAAGADLACGGGSSKGDGAGYRDDIATLRVLSPARRATAIARLEAQVAADGALDPEVRDALVEGLRHLASLDAPRLPGTAAPATGEPAATQPESTAPTTTAEPTTTEPTTTGSTTTEPAPAPPAPPGSTQPPTEPVPLPEKPPPPEKEPGKGKGHDKKKPKKDHG